MSAFGAKVQQLIAQARQLTPEARKHVIELLNEARLKIIARVSDLDPQSHSATQLKALGREVTRALDQFGAQLSYTVNEQQADAFRIGVNTVDQPLSAAGLPSPSYAGYSTHALAVAQGYTADLITGLAKDAAGKVNAAIQRAFLGGQSIGDIIEEIGKALSNGQGFTGIFSAIGKRAEGIATNEVLRVFSIAAQAKMEDAKKHNPQMKKQWVHVPIARVPRIAHIEADGQVVNVDEPFDVDGEELMYPRDPNGSPENTINCHCLVRPYFDAGALTPTARQQQILRDLGISVKAA